MAAEKKTSPNVESRLRHNILKMPQEVYAASGIVINGRRLKSFVFTTDLAIIRNCDADAVFAVYPFTPQQAISDAIIKASYIPVFCGVGGGMRAHHYTYIVPNIFGGTLATNLLIAVVLGGVSFAGGSGSMLGAMMGVIIIGVLNNGMQLIGMDSNMINCVKGIVLLIAIGIDSVQRTGKKAKKV